jgi:hypothetical protein
LFFEDSGLMSSVRHGTNFFGNGITMFPATTS